MGRIEAGNRKPPTLSRALFSRRGRTAGIAALVLVAGGTWLLWPDNNADSVPETAIQNVGGNFRACLLTGPDRAATSQAFTDSAVWSGLMQAAASGRINVQRFPVPTSDAAAMPYVNGVIGQHCDVIVSGPGLTALAAKAAEDNAAQRFLFVGAVTQARNVTSVAAGETRPAAIGEIVRDRVEQLAGR